LSLSPRSSPRAELALAAFVSLLLAFCALWRPVSRLSTHTFGAFDAIAQASPLTAVEPQAGPVHSAQTDPPRQMLPWSLVARAELADGRLPLWNRFNGAGAPLLANMQSGVLSPFNLPFYFLPLKLALLASALLKLFTAHFGASRYLRAIGGSSAASLVGASVFALSGFQLLCLQHPHVGVIALFPAALLFVERSWRQWKSGAPLARDLAALAAVLGLAVLAGHPEALAANVVALALYVVARSLAAVRRELRPASLARFGALLAVAGLGGALLGAAQLVPFLEYLLHSQAYALGGARNESLELAQVASLFVPYLFGSAFDGSLVAAQALAPNFQDALSFCVGPVPVLLLVSALSLAPSRRLAPALAAVVALALLIFDCGALTSLARKLLLFGAIPALRVQGPWLLAWGVLSAVTLDALLERARSKPTSTTVGVALVTTVLAASLAWIGLPAAIDAAVERGFEHAALAGEATQRCTAAGAFALLAALGVCCAVRGARMRVLGASLVVAAHVLGTTSPFARHISTTPDRFVAPRTPSIEQLTRAVGDGRVLFLMHRAPPANSNAFHRIATVANYDALEPNEFAQLRDRCFGPQFFAAETQRATRQALELFGLEFVVTASEWLPIGTQCALGPAERAPQDPYLRFDRSGFPEPRRFRFEVDGRGARQEFEVERAGFDGYVLRWRRNADVARQRIELELEDLTDRRVVDARAFELGELPPIGVDMLENVVRFPPRSDSAGRRYALTVRATGATSESAPQLLRLPTGADDGESANESGASTRGWRLTADEKPQRGRIVLDVSPDTPFARVDELGESTLWRYGRSRGRAWIVSSVEFLPNDEAVFERVLAPSFEPYESVILRGEPANSVHAAAEPASLEALDDQPDRLRFRVDSTPGARLVISRPYYPGWIARIDGVRVPLERANFAFQSVALPGGPCEVELAYESSAVRWSLAASALGWLGVLALLFLRRRAAR
jgi:hypothetical protein